MLIKNIHPSHANQLDVDSVLLYERDDILVEKCLVLLHEHIPVDVLVTQDVLESSHAAIFFSNKFYYPRCGGSR